MKAILFCCMVLIAGSAGAQSNRLDNESKEATKSSTSPAATTLNSTGQYAAKSAYPPLRISDPVIRALNNRTAVQGARLFGNNSLLALPKGTYGYGKGQLWLRTTDATSIGGVTGNSSVGTGSSSGGVGMDASATGVNGKNPYAGSSMWGSAQGLQLPDSLLKRPAPTKKN